MKNIVLIIALTFTSHAIAVCSSPISRTNNSANAVLTSTKYNADVNAVYTRANELPGDCVTTGTITTTQILNETIASADVLNGTLVNADINASAAIDISKVSLFAATISETQTSGTAGGTFTSGTWRTRTINTESDPDSIVSISSNKFTLAAGTYLITGSAPACEVIGHIAKVYNVTDAADAILGSSEYADATASSSCTRSVFSGVVTVASAKEFEVRHMGGSTRNTFGFGAQATIATTVETYTLVTITKIK